MSNFIGPERVDIIAALVSMASLILFLRVWQPKTVWTSASLKGREAETARPAESVGQYTRAEPVRAWTPWLILTVFVVIWGLPPVKA